MTLPVKKKNAKVTASESHIITPTAEPNALGARGGIDERIHQRCIVAVSTVWSQQRCEKKKKKEVRRASEDFECKLTWDFLGKSGA